MNQLTRVKKNWKRDSDDDDDDDDDVMFSRMIKLSAAK